MFDPRRWVLWSVLLSVDEMERASALLSAHWWVLPSVLLSVWQSVLQLE